jgi:hypothetical protein
MEQDFRDMILARTARVEGLVATIEEEHEFPDVVGEVVRLTLSPHSHPWVVFGGTKSRLGYLVFLSAALVYDAENLLPILGMTCPELRVSGFATYNTISFIVNGKRMNMFFERFKKIAERHHAVESADPLVLPAADSGASLRA